MHHALVVVTTLAMLGSSQIATAAAADTTFESRPFASERHVQRGGLMTPWTGYIQVLHYRTSVPGLFHRKEYICNDKWELQYIITYGNYTADTLPGHPVGGIKDLKSVTRIGHWRATGGLKGVPTHWCDLYYENGTLVRAYEREHERFVIPATNTTLDKRD